MAEVTNDNLLSGFLRHAEKAPERPALEVAAEQLSYGELALRAGRIGSAIAASERADEPALTAVYGSRSAAAYAGILGALWAGNGYVPLNPSFPVDRCREMLVRSGARTLVVEGEREELVAELLDGLSDPPAVIAADSLAKADLETIDPVPPGLGGDATAYLLFTSGSTGRPKGVGVAQRNVVAFLEAIRERYDFGPDDRFSQTFDLTFDLSVFDMFVAWGSGGCLCCPSTAQLISPARFIRDSELTVWFSVPSLGAMMRKLRMLKPGSYPTLRWSLFCGEPLPGELARAWAAAAPASTVENLYGPTEATIACTVRRVRPELAGEDEVNGIVSIGAPFGATGTMVVDASLREVEPGEDGELLLRGPQVTPGYWQDAEKTAAAFVEPPGTEGIHYRTGDRVRRPNRPRGPLVYLGRLDHQIKVMGHRVEIGEIEAALRDVSGIDAAIAVGWPLTESGAGGIAAFLADPEADARTLREELAERLPEYMVPRRIELRAELPLNANGKFDRKAMLAMLDETAPAPA
ncbi:MAG TPA: amino acid adenylation domain-containing protein [Solirubrobacterales bacterium]|nr:amino acid adenylation domain-containing protein [Solirubrobacterales bacterium]